MKLLTEYLTKQDELYEYFGYVEDWKVYPIDDARSYFWKLKETEVVFGDEEHIVNDETGEEYVNEIFTVYRGEDYTMIVVVDDNRFLQIFDNSMELNE